MIPGGAPKKRVPFHGYGPPQLAGGTPPAPPPAPPIAAAPLPMPQGQPPPQGPGMPAQQAPPGGGAIGPPQEQTIIDPMGFNNTQQGPQPIDPAQPPAPAHFHPHIRAMAPQQLKAIAAERELAKIRHQLLASFMGGGGPNFLQGVQ